VQIPAELHRSIPSGIPSSPEESVPEPDEPAESRRAFRAAMANLSAAVNVVTTDGPHGLAGMTVSAACSVTDDPPTMLVCLNRSSGSHPVVLANGRLCVNVLATDQQDLAEHFAGATDVRTSQRFGHGSWDFRTHGVPVLEDALASIVGRIVTEHVQGSHGVAFVAVEAVTVRAHSGALVYFQRRFHHLGTFPLTA
jgi:flavin reductase (NADH)